MRQVNFVLIFVICLALVLFGLENTEPVKIQVIEGFDFQAPLVVELIVAMGIGAVLAWVFSVWVQVQRLLESGKAIRERDTRIETLEEDLERYKVEIEQQQRLLPGADTVGE